MEAEQPHRDRMLVRLKATIVVWKSRVLDHSNGVVTPRIKPSGSLQISAETKGIHGALGVQPRDGSPQSVVGATIFIFEPTLTKTPRDRQMAEADCKPTVIFL
jgi:hypothetical protein